MSALSQGLRRALRGIRAYHGSPHNFERFSLEHIGGGEGAQAYGHGLYFAENEGVARSYRDALSKQVNVQGQRMNTIPADGPLSTARHSIVRRVAEGESPISAIQAEAEAWQEAARPYASSNLPGAADQAARFEEVARLVREQAPEDFVKNPGYMYEVRLHAAPEDFLDWDAPLAAQQPRLLAKLGYRSAPEMAQLRALREDLLAREALKTNLPAGASDWDLLYSSDYIDPKLADEYFRVEREIGAARQLEHIQPETKVESLLKPSVYERYDRAVAKERAEALREAGIPGVRFLDQSSRLAGEGSRNYVVFDDSIIEILRKYGIAGLGVGTGGAVTLREALRDRALSA